MTTESSTNTRAYLQTNQTLNIILTLFLAITPSLLRTKQHAVVSIQLNIVACPTYPEKFMRDNVVAPFLLLSVVIVTLPESACNVNLQSPMLTNILSSCPPPLKPTFLAMPLAPTAKLFVQKVHLTI